MQVYRVHWLRTNLGSGAWSLQRLSWCCLGFSGEGSQRIWDRSSYDAPAVRTLSYNRNRITTLSHRSIPSVLVTVTVDMKRNILEDYGTLNTQACDPVPRCPPRGLRKVPGTCLSARRKPGMLSNLQPVFKAYMQSLNLNLRVVQIHSCWAHEGCTGPRRHKRWTHALRSFACMPLSDCLGS